MTPSSEKTTPKLTRILTFSIVVKNKIIKKQPATKLQFSQQARNLSRGCFELNNICFIL